MFIDVLKKLFFSMFLTNVYLASVPQSDFTFYPEDMTIEKDRVGKENELVYGTYYFSNLNEATTNNTILDMRGGYQVKPWQDVNNIF